MIEESVKTIRRCTVTDCDEPAVVHPVVTLVRPKPFAELEIPLPSPFCKPHADAVKMKTLLTSKWWNGVLLQFRLRNQPPPLRESTRLDWETL